MQLWRANAAPNLVCTETLVSVNRFAPFSVWCYLEIYADNILQKSIVIKSEKWEKIKIESDVGDDPH